MTIKRFVARILISALCFSTVFALSACGSEEKHTCLKCNGSGKVRDEYGYYAYVKCPRCQGKGYLVY